MRSKDYGEQIGLGLKKANKPAKTFDQLDKDMAEEIGKSSKTATHTQQDKHPTSADDAR